MERKKTIKLPWKTNGRTEWQANIKIQGFNMGF
jgi:hypothetical protein